MANNYSYTTRPTDGYRGNLFSPSKPLPKSPYSVAPTTNYLYPGQAHPNLIKDAGFMPSVPPAYAQPAYGDVLGANRPTPAGGFMPNSTAPAAGPVTPLSSAAAPVTAGGSPVVNSFGGPTLDSMRDMANQMTTGLRESGIPTYAEQRELDMAAALGNGGDIPPPDGGPGLFTQGLEFLGKNKDGINAGLGLAQTGWGLYSGLKGLGLAEDQFKLNRDMAKEKLAMYQKQYADKLAARDRMLRGTAAYDADKNAGKV